MALLTPLATGSIVEGPNGRDRTGTGLSTNIIIKVGNLAVGAVQSMQITETRNIQMVSEVGTDGHIDSAPTRSTDYSGTITRIRFDRLRATEALGRGFLHIHAQRIPFDIEIFDRWNGDSPNAVISTLKNVWINNISYTYNANDWIITDNVSFMAETMFSIIGGGANAATGGERGANIMQINSIERIADRGQKRGSIDSPGLISDFFSNI